MLQCNVNREDRNLRWMDEKANVSKPPRWEHWRLQWRQHDQQGTGREVVCSFVPLLGFVGGWAWRAGVGGVPRQPLSGRGRPCAKSGTKGWLARLDVSLPPRSELRAPRSRFHHYIDHINMVLFLLPARPHRHPRTKMGRTCRTHKQRRGNPNGGGRVKNA